MFYVWGHNFPVRSTAGFINDVCPDVPLAFVLVVGFHVMMFKWCEMHGVHLGPVMIVNAQALLKLCSIGIYPGGTQAEQLQEASLDFTNWRFREGLQCHSSGIGLHH